MDDLDLIMRKYETDLILKIFYKITDQYSLKVSRS